MNELQDQSSQLVSLGGWLPGTRSSRVVSTIHQQAQSFCINRTSSGIRRSINSMPETACPWWKVSKRSLVEVRPLLIPAIDRFRRTREEG